MDSKIIVMLTNNDRTVPDAIQRFQEVKDLPISRFGFKDVGLEEPKMRRLIADMKAAGKDTFLEVVSYTEDACMAGAKLAVDMGFDYLMGTIYYQSVFAYLSTQNIKFLPFCGKVYGSPSVLEGSFSEIIADGRKLLDSGVFGIDLLSFRHQDGAGLASAYCDAIREPVVIAGSINSFERITFIHQIKPWGFTMGSALFSKNFMKDGTFRENLEMVVRFMASLE